MPKIYGVSKSGRIHREEQTLHDPDNPKPSIYAPKKVETDRSMFCREVTVIDTHEGTSRTYSSIKDASESTGCSPTAIRERLNGRTKSLIYDRYCVAVPSED